MPGSLKTAGSPSLIACEMCRPHVAGRLLGEAVRHREVLEVPLLDELLAALGRLHAHRDHASHARRLEVGQSLVELTELLAADRAVQAADEDEQREPSVGTGAELQVVGRTAGAEVERESRGLVRGGQRHTGATTRRG